ncbi:oligosaccharide flippase family protein [Geomonas sp. RF6]|uniref:lipopolysaccharide biosynthesis protein n=1 Tax=Geomonas sp. RF6 TaxID=2897342 RepID=UPI001E65E059|nr:oligosaccharide flippase family protein [Geomonas sp. RF6]UFS69135.1 oligosaccharide flippase family protein [Geomonas sp. RF6]
MRFADKATLNILAKTAGSVLLMVSSVIMTRYLTKAAYGTYLQAMLIVNTVILLAFVGIPQSIYYYFHVTADRKRFIYRNLLLSIAIGGVVALVMILCAGGISALMGNAELAGYVPYMALIILLQAPLGFRDSIFFSSGAFVANSGSVLCCALLDYLPLFWAVACGFGLREIFLLMIVSKALGLFLFFILLRRCCLSRCGGSPADTGEHVTLLDQIRYAVPISAAGYLGVVGSQLDKYVISNGFSPAQFAVYSRGAMEVPFISTITYLLNDITLPQYIAAYKERNVKLLLDLMHANMDKVAKINLAVFAFLMVEAPLLIETLYTKQYAEAIPVFRVYLLSLLFGVTVYNMIPTVSGNTRMLLHATVISIVTKISCCLLFLKIMGTVGVAAGVFAGSFLYVVYLLGCSVRILGVKWSEIMPWRHVAKISAVAGAAGGATFIFHLLWTGCGLPERLPALATFFVIFCYVYLFALNLAGLVSSEDHGFLRRWLRIDPFLFIPGRRRLPEASRG